MKMRLIDADALMEQPVWLCGGWVGDSYADGYMDALDKVEETVKSAPTIDAVQVVRCKDCVFSTLFQNDSSGVMARYCKAFTIERMVADDDFCSYGERSE